MNHWISSFGFLLCVTLVLSFSNEGRCQDSKPQLQLESFVGLTFYDDKLSFENSMSFGLGAGIGISHLLQLSLAFSYSPTQQRVSQAVSDAEADFSVYRYGLTLKSTPLWMATRFFKPFVGLSGGGMVIDPHPVLLDVGAGQQILVEGNGDHLLEIGLIAGVDVQLANRLGIRLAFNSNRIQLKSPAGASDWSVSNTLQTSFLLDL